MPNSAMPGGVEHTVELTLALPDQLAREAEANGLLKPEALERMLRQEIRRRRVDQLFDAADRLTALSEPAMTEDELLAEIQAARAERRTGHASGA